MKKLYVVTVFNLIPKSLADINKECKILSLKYETEFTIDMWKKLYYKISDYYYFSCNESAYFDDYDKAYEFLNDNTAEINEGFYNRGVIMEIPMNIAYPTVYITNLEIYYFDSVTRNYFLDTEIKEDLRKVIFDYFGHEKEISKKEAKLFWYES